MANVLDEDTKDQVIALGRLGWSLRRIEQATSVRRETASAYLKAAGLPVRGRGRPGRLDSKPAISRGVSTDPEPSKPGTTPEVSTDSDSKPAITEGVVSTGFLRGNWPPTPGRAPSASACEPFRELIVEAL